MIPTIFLPLHVWDREFDSRLVTSYMCAKENLCSVLGHEYNISQVYDRANSALMFRAGRPLDHAIRGEWHRKVTSRGGTVLTQDEEGVNNMPLLYKDSQDSRIACLDHNLLGQNPHHGSPTAFKAVSQELAWGELHKAYLLHTLTNIESRTIALKRVQSKSPIRFELLGELGAAMNQRLSNAYQAIYGDFILVLDNFTVDQGLSKGLIDPSNDLRQAGYSELGIKEYLERQREDQDRENKARSCFANLVIKCAQDFPQLSFILRPHPVLNPEFWQQKFSGIKNINTLYRGSVQPWIHASMATIHSGCTTGLEAHGANKITIDVTNLIESRSKAIEASLIGQSINRPNTLGDLKAWIKNAIDMQKQTQPINLSKNAIIPDKGETYSSNKSKLTTNQRISRISANCRSVSASIRSQLYLLNSTELIGERSCISHIVNIALSLTNSSPQANTKSAFLDQFCLREQNPPNYGKSRYVTAKEVNQRLRDVEYAFGDQPDEDDSIIAVEIGINSFLILKNQILLNLKS